MERLTWAKYARGDALTYGGPPEVCHLPQVVPYTISPARRTTGFLARTFQRLRATSSTIRASDFCLYTAGVFNVDGSLLTRAGAATTGEVHRLVRGEAAQIVAPVGNGTFSTGHQPEGFRSYLDRVTSRDGKLMMYSDTVVNGLKNLFLVDITRDPPAPVTLLGSPLGANAFELFTEDSSHALYYLVDPVTFNSALWAATLAGENRQVSSGNANEFVHFALRGALVAYSDNLIGTGIDLFDHHDVMLADVSAKTIAPRALAPDAYKLFFATPDARSIVYTSDHDPAQSGLFIVKAR